MAQEKSNVTVKQAKINQGKKLIEKKERIQEYSECACDWFIK